MTICLMDVSNTPLKKLITQDYYKGQIGCRVDKWQDRWVGDRQMAGYMGCRVGKWQVRWLVESANGRIKT